jgi:mono/diheme cytochrome c family protein
LAFRRQEIDPPYPPEVHTTLVTGGGNGGKEMPAGVNQKINTPYPPEVHTTLVTGSGNGGKEMPAGVNQKINTPYPPEVHTTLVTGGGNGGKEMPAGVNQKINTPYPPEVHTTLVTGSGNGGKEMPAGVDQKFTLPSPVYKRPGRRGSVGTSQMRAGVARENAPYPNRKYSTEPSSIWTKVIVTKSKIIPYNGTLTPCLAWQARHD